MSKKIYWIVFGVVIACGLSTASQKATAAEGPERVPRVLAIEKTRFGGDPDCPDWEESEDALMLVVNGAKDWHTGLAFWLSHEQDVEVIKRILKKNRPDLFSGDDEQTKAFLDYVAGILDDQLTGLEDGPRSDPESPDVPSTLVRSDPQIIRRGSGTESNRSVYWAGDVFPPDPGTNVKIGPKGDLIILGTFGFSQAYPGILLQVTDSESGGSESFCLAIGWFNK